MRVTIKRATAAEQFVEHDAKRKDVGADVRGLALGLLGRHVGSGPHESSSQRLWQGLCSQLRGLNRLCQAEVQELYSLACDQDICRLQVAVNDALVVSGFDGTANFQGDP